MVTTAHELDEAVLEGLRTAHLVDGPDARSRPCAMTATWSHMRCTRSIEWLDTMTVPPEAV